MIVKTRVIFSKRLREAIDNSPYNQRAFAEKLGVSTDTVQRWVTGKSLPSPDNLDTICETLNVSPAWLMGGSDSTPTRAEIILESIKILNSIDDIQLAKDSLEAILEGESLKAPVAQKRS